MSDRNRALDSFLEFLKKAGRGAGKGVASELLGTKQVENEMDNSLKGFVKRNKKYFVWAGVILLVPSVVGLLIVIINSFKNNKQKRYGR